MWFVHRRCSMSGRPCFLISTTNRRVLAGTIDVRSLDWADAPATFSNDSPLAAAAGELAASRANGADGLPKQDDVHYARVSSHRRYSADSPIMEIHPRRCNLHEIRALESSAFIDVAMPSYSEDRACTYFVEVLSMGSLRVASDCSWSTGGDASTGLFRQCACPLAQRITPLRITKSDYEVQAEPYRGPRIVLPPAPPAAAAVVAVTAVAN